MREIKIYLKIAEPGATCYSWFDACDDVFLYMAKGRKEKVYYCLLILFMKQTAVKW